MPTLFCCILNCESESVNCKKRKIFYRLPQNSDRKQLWLNQIGERIKYGTVSSNSRICNSHFATGKPNLDSSHVDYMPTIFPWSTKEEKMKSFKSVEEYESKIKELEQKILAKAFLNASSGSKLSQESSTTRYELPENDICSKLIIDTDPQPASDFNKNRQQKLIPAKINSNSEINGIEQRNIVITNSLEKSISTDPGKIPIYKESSIPCHTNQHNIPQNLNTQSTIQLVPDNSVSIKSNLLNYLLSSIARVNMANNNNNNNSDLTKSSLSVNVSMPAGPLNLSQTYNKLDDQSVKKEKVNEIDPSKKEPLKKESISQPNEPNLDTNINVTHIKNSISKSQTPPDRTGTPSEETTSRSCTCTKSSCLKLYCECFANGNLCCSGCTCINCRNNDNHKEERAKIVSSYLERDPWVFNSKIENKDVGKKHSKGCNCLKSSCLKNYCECFENKVFCSSLCRCRMCYNNEEHTQHNNKDDTKIYASSHTSESLSVMSENSPRNINRKRKKSSLKTNDIYEDVSSNESEDEVNTKRCQLDSEAISVDNDKRSNRSINSMEIPPVLPQEDDFTEEELALMVKFREQRTEKPSNLKLECVSPPVQCNQSFINAVTNVITPSVPQHVSITSSSPLINIPAHLDSNLLLTLSKSLAVANLGLNGLNVVNTTVQDTKRPTGIDLLGLLATQQLMVSRPSTEVGNLNCISVPQNCNHVIPINLTQIPPLPPAAAPCLTQITQLPSTVVTQSRIVTTSPTAVTSSVCQSKPKLSTEDYVRKHIEAAERAVRADYMRKDSSNYKKPITKHKIKIDPFPPVNQKPSQIINNIKPGVVGTANMVNTNDISRLIINQPPIFNKAQYEEQPNNGMCTGSNSTMTTVSSHLTNGGGSVDPTTISSISTDINPPASNLSMYNWIPPALPTQNSSSVLHTVQINCQSNTLSENHDQVNKSTTDSQSRDKHVSRGKMKSLRHSFQSLRNEIRSLKFHMRADQSRLRRLEKNLHQLRNQIGK